MLGHALRRLLWTIPALIGVSLVTFLFLSYVPDPTDDPAFAARNPPAEVERLRRELVRLGGAALPFVIPRFDALEPDRRQELALALAPIAERMGLVGRQDA